MAQLNFYGVGADPSDSVETRNFLTQMYPHM